MYSFEIYNEVIKDLIASRGALSGILQSFYFILFRFAISIVEN